MRKLYDACNRADVDKVRSLLKSGDADEMLVNFKEVGLKTPLMVSCEKGYIGIVTLLLSQEKIRVNEVNSRGKSSLFLACENGQSEIVSQLLMRKEIKVNHGYTGYPKRTPLGIACTKGHIDVVKELLLHPNIDLKKFNPLRDATRDTKVLVKKYKKPKGRSYSENKKMGKQGHEEESEGESMTYTEKELLSDIVSLSVKEDLEEMKETIRMMKKEMDRMKEENQALQMRVYQLEREASGMKKGDNRLYQFLVKKGFDEYYEKMVENGLDYEGLTIFLDEKDSNILGYMNSNRFQEFVEAVKKEIGDDDN